MNLRIFSLITLLTFASFTGCSPGHPQVSGIVTLDGKPLANIEVVFSPKLKDDSANVGLPSSAVTDASGSYSLKLRDGKRGAIAGNCDVGFRWSDIHPGAIESLQNNLQEAGEATERAAEIKKQIAEIQQKISSRPKLPKKRNVTFIVPAEGTGKADFELSELASE